MSKLGKLKIDQYPRQKKLVAVMNSWADSHWSSNKPITHNYQKKVFEDFFNGQQSINQIAKNYNVSIGRIDIILVTKLLTKAKNDTDSKEIDAFRVWLEFNYRIESEYKKFKKYEEEGYYNDKKEEV